MINKLIKSKETNKVFQQIYKKSKLAKNFGILRWTKYNKLWRKDNNCHLR